MSNRKPDEKNFEQAEFWFAHLESGEANAADRRRFQAWLHDSAAHRQALLEVAKLCDGIATLKHLASEEYLAGGPSNIFAFPAAQQESVRASLSPGAKWRLTRIAAGLVIVGLVGWGVARWYSGPLAGYDTAKAQIKTVALADGSRVTLGAQSKIRVAYTDNERRILLQAGEAFFSVRPDASRPFFVRTGDATVRVVGTQFSVHTGGSRTTVEVAEGVVEVLKGGTGSIPLLESGTGDRLRLTEGQKLVVAHGDGDVREVRPIKKEEAGSWRSGHLIYDDVPLREVIADANRYYNRRIVIGSDDIGDLRVTAAFPSQQIDRMLDGLADLLPIQIQHDTVGEIVLSSRVTQIARQTSSH